MAHQENFCIQEDVHVSPAHFDDRVFQDFRELLGDPHAIAALLDLASSLETAFQNPTAGDQDKIEISRKSHFFIARAGIMGFISLRDACLALQTACAVDISIEQAYLNACKSAVVTREIIRILVVQSD